MYLKITVKALTVNVIEQNLVCVPLLYNPTTHTYNEIRGSIQECSIFSDYMTPR